MVVTPCLQLSQHSIPHYSPSTTMSYKKISLPLNDVVSTSWFRTTSSKRISRSMQRACASSSNSNSFSDDEFVSYIEELAEQTYLSDDEIVNKIEQKDEQHYPKFKYDGDQMHEIQPQLLDFKLNIEIKANRLEIPLSLRLIKRKQQFHDGILKAGESACCSMRKALTSMVLIIREIYSYALQIREIIYYEDLREILARVERDIHASFLWLFEQVFAQTPTLMVYVMILLANFTLFSMPNSSAIAKTTSFVRMNLHRRIVHPGVSRLSTRGLDEESMRSFVSPVKVKIESDLDYEEYFRTGLIYQMGLAQDPNNVMLLGNYAQFLFLVVRDYDRAEEYFKRAIKVEPKDAIAHQRYAYFLWQVRKDLWAAEETLLEAISAEPENQSYLIDYAYFLWKTGNQGICFPALHQVDAHN